MPINPYENVDWQNIIRVPSCSHAHCESQEQFDIFNAEGGLKHFAISNYYPSVPCYPLSSVYTVPSDTISSPNAEHHYIFFSGSINPRFHVNGLGSFFESGSARGHEPMGCNGDDVSSVVQNILSRLQYADGGGVTINHPGWSLLTEKQIKKLLDIDDRVLGIEIYSTDQIVFDPYFNDNMRLWDSALMSGRRCWAFCVSDHAGQVYENWNGRNILLVSEFTERECLKAYREGRFYGRIKNSNLNFLSISLSGNTYSVETENADYIKIIIDGEQQQITGNSASVEIPNGATYVRSEGWTDDDAIFSNPIMFKGKKRTGMTSTMRMLLYSE